MEKDLLFVFIIKIIEFKQQTINWNLLIFHNCSYVIMYYMFWDNLPCWLIWIKKSILNFPNSELCCRTILNYEYMIFFFFPHRYIYKLQDTGWKPIIQITCNKSHHLERGSNFFSQKACKPKEMANRNIRLSISWKRSNEYMIFVRKRTIN